MSDDLMAAFDKSYELYCLNGRITRSLSPSIKETYVLPEALKTEVMNESYGVNPTPWYKEWIPFNWEITMPNTAIVKIGEQIDMKDQIRNFEIKKKSTKKGDAIVYSCNFGYGCEDIKYTIESYEEYFLLAPEVVIALFPIMWKSATGKLIFRDRKVIAITRNKIMQILKEPDKNGNKTKYGHVSYVANCMDADRYNPYTGALIAISKHVNGSMPGTPNSKSEIKRLYKQIDDFYADFK